MCMLTNASSSSHLGLKTPNARSSINKWFTLDLSIIYGSPWSSHIILIKNSSKVWSLFALEALIHLGILCDLFSMFPHQLIKYFKGYFILHHLIHIWSSMSPKSQENVKLARWFMVVDQRKSTGQNWGSIDHISYNFYQMKMIPREKLHYMTFQTTFMLSSRGSLAWKVIFLWWKIIGHFV